MLLLMLFSLFFLYTTGLYSVVVVGVDRLTDRTRWIEQIVLLAERRFRWTNHQVVVWHLAATVIPSEQPPPLFFSLSICCWIAIDFIWNWDGPTPTPPQMLMLFHSSHNGIIPCTVGGKTVATRVRASTSIHPYLFNITDAPTHPAIALLLLMIIIEPINDFVFISNGFSTDTF